jgi:hypothetical protein
MTLHPQNPAPFGRIAMNRTTISMKNFRRTIFGEGYTLRMLFSIRSPRTAPRIRPHAWLWLLLALWMFTQTWAWHHRVEHDAHLQGAQALSAQVQASAEAATANGAHAGTACEWLDHALLASAVGTSSAHLPVAHLPACSPIRPLRSFANAQTERPYLARAPPAPHRFLEGRVTG